MAHQGAPYGDAHNWCLIACAGRICRIAREGRIVPRLRVAIKVQDPVHLWVSDLIGAGACSDDHISDGGIAAVFDAMAGGLSGFPASCVPGMKRCFHLVFDEGNQARQDQNHLVLCCVPMGV